MTREKSVEQLIALLQRVASNIHYEPDLHRIRTTNDLSTMVVEKIPKDDSVEDCNLAFVRRVSRKFCLQQKIYNLTV